MSRPPIEAQPCRTCGGDAWFPPEGGRMFGTVCETCLGSGSGPDPDGWAFGLGAFLGAVFVAGVLIWGARETVARLLGIG